MKKLVSLGELLGRMAGRGPLAKTLEIAKAIEVVRVFLQKSFGQKAEGIQILKIQHAVLFLRAPSAPAAAAVKALEADLLKEVNAEFRKPVMTKVSISS